MADGVDLRTLKEKELARKIAYIPQNHDQAFAFSVLDMVMMGTTSSLQGLKSPGREQREAAFDALKTMRIEAMAERSYAHLSGGEQQLVLIARAIAQQAGILIMDEPCANLDYGNQARVMEELKRLAGEGYLIVQSTQQPGSGVSLCRSGCGAFRRGDKGIWKAGGGADRIASGDHVRHTGFVLFDAGDTGEKAVHARSG